MRFILFVVFIISTVSPAYSANLGNRAPSKTNAQMPSDVPITPRQGGDTIADATPIGGISFDCTGTTSGFNDDYDISCPYPGWAPDVVYSYSPEADLLLTVDLFGSQYDTKVFILDEMMLYVACNDNYHEDDTSKIVAAPLLGGQTYSIIIDGYTDDHGQYVMHLEEYNPCEIFCPDGAILEGEPPLSDDYVDAHNGGCNSLEMLGYAPFQAIESSIFCGTTGWYEYNSEPARDTDWYTAIIPEIGFLEISAIAELNTNFFELAPQDCGSVSIVQSILLWPCQEQTMIISGEAGTETWLWLGPPDNLPPWYFEGEEYDYILFTNIQDTVAIEQRNWDEIKALYR